MVGREGPSHEGGEFTADPGLDRHSRPRSTRKVPVTFGDEDDVPAGTTWTVSGDAVAAPAATVRSQTAGRSGAGTIAAKLPAVVRVATLLPLVARTTGVPLTTALP